MKTLPFAIIVAGFAAHVVASVTELRCAASISDANYQQEVDNQRQPWAFYLYSSESESVYALECCCY